MSESPKFRDNTENTELEDIPKNTNLRSEREDAGAKSENLSTSEERKEAKVSSQGFTFPTLEC